MNQTTERPTLRTWTAGRNRSSKKSLQLPGGAPLPHSEESERAVLGALLLDPELFRTVPGRLGVDDLYSERHQVLYRAMLDLDRDGVTPDLRTLQAHLEKHGELDMVGGLAYLSGLDLDLPDINRVSSYVEVIKERAVRRRLIQVSGAVVRDCLDGSTGADSAIHAMEAAILRANRDLTPDAAMVGPVRLEAFLEEVLPSRPWLIRGVAQDRDVIGLHAFRGVGKSMALTYLALHCVTGRPFLRWEIPEPFGVLLVDGEMPQQDLQKRLASAKLSAELYGAEIRAPLELLPSDRFPAGLPSLATVAGQRIVERSLAESSGVKLVVLDSVATLCHDPEAPDPNSEESWRNAVQPWILSLKRRGYTVLVVYHDGKNGKDRGTSAREDVMSQILHLTHPQDYRPDQGCRFRVHLAKPRGVYGAEAEDFEAQLSEDQNGRHTWIWAPCESAGDRRLAQHLTMGRRVDQLMSAGKTKQQAAAELSISPRSAMTYRKVYREHAGDGAGATP